MGWNGKLHRRNDLQALKSPWQVGGVGSAWTSTGEQVCPECVIGTQAWGRTQMCTSPPPSFAQNCICVPIVTRPDNSREISLQARKVWGEGVQMTSRVECVDSTYICHDAISKECTSRDPGLEWRLGLLR